MRFVFLQSLLFFCASVANAAPAYEVSPTENFLAYLQVLLEDRTIEDIELNRLLDSIEASNLENPISEKESHLSIVKSIAHSVMEQLLEQGGLEAEVLATW